MKTILFMCLVAVSIIASEVQGDVQDKSLQEEVKYIIDAKNYGLVAAKDAYYVIDSHKYGTMQEYFAFAKQEDAKDHVEKYGGSVVDYETYTKMKSEGLIK
ncbi:MAG: nitrous oxide reductase accessory protein NosL [Sulfurimonas sp.]|uniref:nitrous oxide reductase accessory protein NosL n=1 Tax=Sulfurimonas sp. TaxID=2022749 RepID=UPI0025EF7BC4|nr:nitrous oxide reductase accessory protein NosL [Sulfurimonas sp.]MCK9454661.1 nitrous oxide reductase accessory protein NosL [Sulfurimonas sp.]